jgi:hypothetical protein
MKEEIKLVFTGSEIDANFIEQILEEYGIGVLKRNSMNESLIAGWASGSPEDACELFVEDENEQKAADLIAAYLKNRI